MPDPDPTPAWLTGRGRTPGLKWQLATGQRISSLCLARETGELMIAEADGTLFRVDRNGRTLAVAELHEPVIAMHWSDDGSAGAVIAGDSLVLRIDRRLNVTHRITVPEVCLSLALSPFGNHLATGLADGRTLIFNERKRRIAQFETLRPLACLKFCTSEAILFGAAENGLICCYNLAGALIWQQKDWSNVGRMCATGEGDLIYLASFSHGVQTFDGDGVSVGAYLLEGTVNRVDCTDEPQRILASTVERSLFWLNAAGNILWQTDLPADVVDVLCDPLGKWAICGLSSNQIVCFGWQVP